MKSDFKYIIKRIIVGFAIGLILFNLKSCKVNAQSLYFTPSSNSCYIQYMDVSTTPFSYTQSTGTVAYDKIWSNSNNSIYCSFSGILQRSTFEGFYVGAGSRWLNQNFRDKSVNLKFTIFQKPTAIIGDNGTSYRYWEIGGLTISPSLSVNNGFACELVESRIPNSDTNSIASYYYECKNVVINTNSNYYFIISAPKAAANFRISQYFEAVESAEQQINNSINDSDTSNSFSFFNQISIAPNSILTQILTIPIRFYGKVKAQINTNNCVGIELPFNKLPFSSYIDYDRNVIIPCFRDTIENDLGFTYYETIGTICGGALLLVYVIHRGKGLLKMSVMENNDEGVWGGLS